MLIRSRKMAVEFSLLVLLLMCCGVHWTHGQGIPGQVDHSSVTVELITFFSARLMWPEPKTNNGLNLRYNVGYCKILDGECGTGPFFREASDRSIVLSELAIRSTYQVTIEAGNDVGVGPVPSFFSNETFTFVTVDEDDVILMNVNADIVTESRVVLSWEVPDIALDTPDVTEGFSIFYVRRGDDIVNSADVLGNSLAMVITELDSDAQYTFSVTVVYSFSGGSLESTPVYVVNRTRVEDFTPATAIVGEETPDGRFTISWSRPSGFQFLVQYVVNIVRSSLRRRRQAMTVLVSRDDTSYDFQADPFMQYMVDVSGDFDVNGMTFSDSVAASVTFQSNEQVPSEPLHLNVATTDFTTLNLIWDLPASPNGIITSFRVTYVPPDRTETITVSGNNPTFSHILMGLTPNTQYSITVEAVNGAGTGGPATTVGRTDLGVVKPVIASFEKVRNQPRIKIEIDPFSTMKGELSHFMIVVAVGFAPVPSSISDAALVPFAEGSTLYVAGAFVHTGPRAFIIGDGSSHTLDGTTFTNPELTAGSVYYAFVRLYSAEDATLSADSDVPQGVAPTFEVSVVSSTSRLPDVAPYNTFNLTCTATAPEGVIAPKIFIWRRANPADVTCGDFSVVGGNVDSNIEQPVSTSTLNVTVSNADIETLRYCCQVSIIDLGIDVSDNSVTSITVVGPVQPVAPINLRSRNTGATSATIEWTVSIVIYTPESYVVNYIAGACLGQPLMMSVPVQSGTDFESENQTFSVDLTGLVDNTTYSYQVVATNSVGSTTSAPQSFIFSDPSDPGAGCSSDSVGIVGGVLGTLVALLLAYGVITTVVIVVLMLRIRQGKVSIDQPVHTGVKRPVKWSAMTKLEGPDIKTSECVAYGQAQPPSTGRAEDTK